MVKDLGYQKKKLRWFMKTEQKAQQTLMETQR